MTEMPEVDRIEDLYRAYKRAGGQAAQLDLDKSADEISAAFQTTVDAVGGQKGEGPFHPPGGRKALFDLNAERRSETDALADTQHLQALLWSPPRWSIEQHSDLDFMFVAREITPGSAVAENKRRWVIEEKYRVSADLLLMNVHDRTPIVGEFKRGGDENAEYALIQTLTAAAQLSSPWQRKRLQVHYSEYFGKEVPERFDVYVILADRPAGGTRPELLERARSRADELQTSGALDNWIRRVVFLDAGLAGSHLSFELLHEARG